jgi:hypothetical protein
MGLAAQIPPGPPLPRGRRLAPDSAADPQRSVPENRSLSVIGHRVLLVAASGILVAAHAGCRARTGARSSNRGERDAHGALPKRLPAVRPLDDHIARSLTLAQDDCHAAGAVARLQETQRKRIDPVQVTVGGEACSDHGGSRASAERTGGSDARIWWKQHRAQSRDNRPGKRPPRHRGPQPGTAAADRPHPGPQPGTAAADRPHPGPQPGTASPPGGCIEGEANRAGLTAGPGSASCRLDAA